LVRTEGARLGLAHAVASEPHAASALADERLIDRRRRSQDHPSQGDSERRTQDHREARDAAAQGDREAQHHQAQHCETDHREAWRPQDDRAPQDRKALDGEAHDAPELGDPKEAPLSR